MRRNKIQIFSRVQPCLVISLLINHVTNAGIQVELFATKKELHLFTFLLQNNQ